MCLLNVSKMKKVLFTFLFSLLSVLVVNAQTEYTLHSQSEMKAYLEKMVAQKWFIGGPLSELYDAFKKVGFPINYMSTTESGAYVNSDGADYTTGVVIFNEDVGRIRAGAYVFIVYVSLDIYMKDRELWRGLPDEGWMEGLQKRTREYRIMNITYKYKRIFPLRK